MTQQKKKLTTKTKQKTQKEITKKKKNKSCDNLHTILRRKKILCHTCKHEKKCYDAIHKTYPYICMVYEARVD